MSSSSLDSEDLENVPLVVLVRMEDVQPSRDRIVEASSQPQEMRDEVYETFIDNLEYDNECIVDEDGGSNIGSMVSIKSEDLSETNEFIVPDVLDVEAPKHLACKPEKVITVEVQEQTVKTNNSDPESWPTLEILPGGVVNPYDNFDKQDSGTDEHNGNSVQMVYACAKCSQGFNDLFSLVKHVRLHEDDNKNFNTAETPTVNVNPQCKATQTVGKRYSFRHTGTHAKKRRISKRLKPKS